MYIHTRTHTRLQFRQIIFYNFVTARKLFAGANDLQTKLQTTCKQLDRVPSPQARECHGCACVRTDRDLRRFLFALVYLYRLQKKSA